MYTICHNLLLAKLHAYGVGEKRIDFLHSYLSGRKQRVKVNGVFSDWLPVYCGAMPVQCIYQRSEFFCSTLFPEALCWWHYRLRIQYRHFSIGTVSYQRSWESLILVCFKLFVRLAIPFFCSFTVECVSWYWVGRIEKKKPKKIITRRLGIVGPGTPRRRR